MHRYDVAIIGAGLVGCAAAYELSKRKQRVIVLEQGELNRGASGRNAGSLHFQLEPRMLHALASDPERLSQLIPVSRQAIDDWQDLPAQLGCDLEVTQRGGILVAESDSDRELLARKAELERRCGLAVQTLEGAELRRIAPYLSGRVRCANFLAEEGYANPLRVTAAYWAAARALGTTILLRRRVLELEPQPGRWRVGVEALSSRASGEAIREAVEASMVLIAAGAWSREILAPLGIKVPLDPLALTMSVTQRAPRMVAHLVQHVGRPLSMKQVESGNLLIGGGWRARLPNGPVLGPEPKTLLQESAIIANAAVAVSVVPGIAQLNLLRCWTGIASVSPDDLPVLGAMADFPGLFIAAGGSAFTLGPTYARLISELICQGTASMPLDCYRPDRFECAASHPRMPVHGLPNHR